MLVMEQDYSTSLALRSESIEELFVVSTGIEHSQSYYGRKRCARPRGGHHV